MNILPSEAPIDTSPDWTTEALARVDGCPDCVVNVEVPYRVELEADGYTAFYRCSDCAAMWRTGWGR